MKISKTWTALIFFTFILALTASVMCTIYIEEDSGEAIAVISAIAATLLVGVITTWIIIK